MRVPLATRARKLTLVFEALDRIATLQKLSKIYIRGLYVVREGRLHQLPET